MNRTHYNTLKNSKYILQIDSKNNTIKKMVEKEITYAYIVNYEGKYLGKVSLWEILSENNRNIRKLETFIKPCSVSLCKLDDDKSNYCLLVDNENHVIGEYKEEYENEI